MTSSAAIARLVAVVGLLLAASPALAAEQNVEYAKETVIDFEDDTIQGDLTRPDGEHVDARQKVRHTNLIKVRESFRDEVLESVGEL
ncbi:adventurous gliding motility protein CglF [Vulgatibacter sp.]|uniref:adventurous gliding motility protein CglF n=1 Tax=Vulgatibacter sp. TaxID=1971226 RepID=UPI003562A6F5